LRLLASRQFASFVIVGGCSTALQYAILIAWVRGLAGNPATGSLIGYILSSIFNYVANYYVTFGTNKRHIEAVLKFMVVMSGGALLNYGIVFIFANGLHVHYLLAQVIATATTLMTNFYASQRWAFSPSIRSPRADVI
jgi:putative flippase GtrA